MLDIASIELVGNQRTRVFIKMIQQTEMICRRVVIIKVFKSVGSDNNSPIVQRVARTGGGTAPNPSSSTNLRISMYLAVLSVGRPDRRQLCGGPLSVFCGGLAGQLHASSTHRAAFAVGRPDRRQLCGGSRGQAVTRHPIPAQVQSYEFLRIQRLLRWADRTGANCAVGH